MSADYVNEVRYKMGQAKIAEFSKGPSVTDSVMNTLNKVAPHMARQAMEFVLGDVLSRPGLDAKTRELLNVAVLTAIGAELELKLHANVALNIGCTREQIVETYADIFERFGFDRREPGLTEVSAKTVRVSAID